MFFSIQGNKLNGNNYIKDAKKNGSKIIVFNLSFEGFNKKIFYLLKVKIQEKHWRRLQVIFIQKNLKISLL